MKGFKMIHQAPLSEETYRKINCGDQFEYDKKILQDTIGIENGYATECKQWDSLIEVRKITLEGFKTILLTKEEIFTMYNKFCKT